MPDLAPLTHAELEVLEFARETFPNIALKETAILERFDHSLTRYYQRLNVVLDKPAALAYDAMLVRRLLARRTRFAAARSGTGVVL